jgi:hypothetical protein
MRARIEVKVLFHICEPGRETSERRIAGLPDAITDEERRRGVWSDFFAESPRIGRLLEATEEQLRAETGVIDDTCQRGHLWAENTGVSAAGGRYCKACNRAGMADRRRSEPKDPPRPELFHGLADAAGEEALLRRLGDE